jgi:cytochrome c biogenesis protein CcmG/thiol:disulfide interchange protein DsbE
MKTSLVPVIVLAMAATFGGAGQAQEAKEFDLSSLAGNKISLHDYRGKVVLLNFWATWCSPCREELPELQRLQDKDGDRGLVVLALSVDNEEDNIRQFLKKYEIKLLALWDREKKVAEAYDVDGMPSSFIIDRRGTLRSRHRGYRAEELRDIERQIGELLEERVP